jgi:hypothetical protein
MLLRVKGQCEQLGMGLHPAEFLGRAGDDDPVDVLLGETLEPCVFVGRSADHSAALAGGGRDAFDVDVADVVLECVTPTRSRSQSPNRRVGVADPRSPEAPARLPVDGRLTTGPDHERLQVGVAPVTDDSRARDHGWANGNSIVPRPGAGLESLGLASWSSKKPMIRSRSG